MKIEKTQPAKNGSTMNIQKLSDEMPKYLKKRPDQPIRIFKKYEDVKFFFIFLVLFFDLYFLDAHKLP